MTRRLSPLERRGLEAVARDELIGHRAIQSKILMRFLNSPDVVIPFVVTSVARLQRGGQIERGYSIRCVQRLRETLVDVGFPPDCIIAETGVGYRMPKDRAGEIIAWLEERA